MAVQAQHQGAVVDVLVDATGGLGSSAHGIGPVPAAGQVVLIDPGDDVLATVAKMGGVVIEGIDGGARRVGGGDVGESVLHGIGKNALEHRVHVHGDDVRVAVGDAGQHGVPGSDLVSGAIRHAGPTAPVVQLGDEQPAVLGGCARLHQALHAGLVARCRTHQPIRAAQPADVVVAQVDDGEVPVRDGCVARQCGVDLLVERAAFTRHGAGATDRIVVGLADQAAGLQLGSPVDGADGTGERGIGVAVTEHPQGVDPDLSQVAAAGLAERIVDCGCA